MKNKVITIFGGSGFIGSYIAKELIKAGAYVKILSRYPERASFLRTIGKVGQVYFQKVDIYDHKSIMSGLQNSDIVINLIGVSSGSKKRISYINTVFPNILANFVRKLRIIQLIHFSALGIKRSYDSLYAYSKYEGEKGMLKEFPQAIIIRPSVVFGAQDKFINKLAFLISAFPIFPLLNNGNTRFQPIYIGDVAKTVMRIIAKQQGEFSGDVFEIVGDKTYSLKKIIELLKLYLHIDILEVNVPYVLYMILLQIAGFLLRAPIVVGQLSLINYNNVIDKRGDAKGLEELAIKPRDFEEVLKSYMCL